jgi:hypothetical protein
MKAMLEAIWKAPLYNACYINAWFERNGRPKIMGFKMTKSTLVDIDVYVFMETNAAYLVSDTGDRRNAVWVAKSQCELERKKEAKGVLTLPEWVAEDKGLI